MYLTERVAAKQGTSIATTQDLRTSGRGNALTLLSFELLAPALPPSAARRRASSHPPLLSQSFCAFAADAPSQLFSPHRVRIELPQGNAARVPTHPRSSLTHRESSGPKRCALARPSPLLVISYHSAHVFTQIHVYTSFSGYESGASVQRFSIPQPSGTPGCKPPLLVIL